jgi:[ribosomal protein S18]-alanine N-acetyltransferase
MIAIRPMAADDLDWVLSLEASTPEAPHWSRAVYERFLLASETNDLRHAGWVAVDSGNLMGFAAATLVLDVCELESIVVVETARRKGIGEALLNEVSTWALAHGAVRMELEVRAGNERAIRFYEKAGWIEEGLRRGYYRGPEEDAVLMGKTMKPISYPVENFPEKFD